MRKRLIITSIIIAILIIALILTVFVGIPKYKFSKDYEFPHGLTPEQTIDKLFDYIDNNNPKQANLLFVEPIYSAFSFSNVISAGVNNIECTGKPSQPIKYKDFYESKEFLVNYECRYLPLGEEKVFWGPSGSIFITLVKETENSDWKIVETYTGP